MAVDGSGGGGGGTMVGGRTRLWGARGTGEGYWCGDGDEGRGMTGLGNVSYECGPGSTDLGNEDAVVHGGLHVHHQLVTQREDLQRDGTS